MSHERGSDLEHAFQPSLTRQQISGTKYHTHHTVQEILTTNCSYLYVYSLNLQLFLFWSKSRYGEIFRPSRPALGPTQCPVQWVPGLSWGKVRPGVLLTTHPLLVPRSWKSRAIPLPTLWATTGPLKGTLYLYLLPFCSLLYFL